MTKEGLFSAERTFYAAFPKSVFSSLGGVTTLGIFLSTNGSHNLRNTPAVLAIVTIVSVCILRFTGAAWGHIFAAKESKRAGSVGLNGGNAIETAAGAVIFFSWLILCWWLSLAAVEPELRSPYVCLFISAFTLSAVNAGAARLLKFLTLPLLTLPFFLALNIGQMEAFTLSVSLVFVELSGFFFGRLYSEYNFKIAGELSAQSNKLEYFRSVIEAVPGLVTIFDRDLKYKLINSRVLEFTGLSEEFFEGKSIGFNNHDEFAQLIKKFYFSNESQVQTKMLMTGKGGPRWYLVTMSRLVDQAQIAVISLDIDDQVKAEIANRESQAVAEGTAKMAVIGELAAGIAHEINNPISIITLKAEQALYVLKKDRSARVEEDLKLIRDTGFRVAKIVRGLKGLSRNGERDPRVPFKILNVVQDIAVLLNLRLKSSEVELRITVPADLVVYGVATQIGQVILNLISNSIDAISGKPAGWIEIAAARNGLWVELMVTDSGDGIPEAVRKKLMTPFFTTKGAGVGTGLGLSIARRIVVDHGGKFFLDENHKHTRFVLILPSEAAAEKAS